TRPVLGLHRALRRSILPLVCRAPGRAWRVRPDMNSIHVIPSLMVEERFNDPAHWSTFGAQWGSADSQRLECVSVVYETHDVKTFTFRSPVHPAIAYEPGQFLTVSPLIDGQTVSRCYTLS